MMFEIASKTYDIPEKWDKSENKIRLKKSLRRSQQLIRLEKQTNDWRNI